MVSLTMEECEMAGKVVRFVKDGDNLVRLRFKVIFHKFSIHSSNSLNPMNKIK